jgi:hypothetical protein
MSDPTPLNILYVGPLGHGQTCLQRMLALRDLGHHVVAINSRPDDVARAETRLLRRLQRRVLGPRDLAGVNPAILAALRERPFDVLWIDKGLVVEAETLRAARAVQPDCKIVGFTLDDMARRDCTSRQFRSHLPHYDIFFTNKSYAVAELLSGGARRVEFLPNGFDPATHRPVPVSPDQRLLLGGPVGFIGDFEHARARSILAIVASGIGVRVWGPNWHRLRARPPGLRIEGRPLLGDEYATAICAFDVNLGFLRKSSRDRQTTRSVEIPACGAFLLAERTHEHQNLFEEGREAEFFVSDQELVRKVRYYLEHAEERIRIASAGRARCVTSKYSNHDHLTSMLGKLRELPRRRV